MKKLMMPIAFLFLILSGCGGVADVAEANGDSEPPPEPEQSRYSELIEYTEALVIFEEGMEAEVLDIETGLTYRVRRVTGGYNTIADVETLTREDTDNLLETAGGDWSVQRRAIIITVGDRRIAASIAPFQHSGDEAQPFGAIVDARSGATGTGVNLDSIRGNGMIGVVDIYFFNSLVPGINRTEERHQEMVLRAFDFEG